MYLFFFGQDDLLGRDHALVYSHWSYGLGHLALLAHEHQFRPYGDEIRAQLFQLVFHTVRFNVITLCPVAVGDVHDSQPEQGQDEWNVVQDAVARQECSIQHAHNVLWQVAQQWAVGMFLGGVHAMRSAILNLALRERGFRSSSAVVGVIGFLVITLNGVIGLP